MEFVLGAASAGCAVVFTNPLEVVKTRFQLQGELKSKGKYAVHYKSIIHAFFTIFKNEGIIALQKGLSAAVAHQFLLNGTRLGIYNVLEDHRLLYNKENTVSLMRTLVAGSLTGVVGAYASSPIYLVKTHQQSRSHVSIAVGYQHDQTSVTQGLKTIYTKHGITGLWRGVNGAAVRIAAGSAVQLSSFLKCKEFFTKHELLTPDQKITNAFLSSLIGGICIALVMGPLDLISTRLYNQGVDSSGKGLYYKSYMDCVLKTYKAEGFSGFYKGVLPCYFRIGPHSVLCLVFWDLFKDIYQKYYKTNVL